ncbi:MAG: hypothetical protein WBQ21_05660 [Solirubrobacteraceae bacterium]
MTEARTTPQPAIAALLVSIFSALAILAIAVLAPIAAAAPEVTLKLTPLPIAGVPGTGNLLGAGAAVEANVTISGSEYGGYPSPLTGIDFFAPAGVKIASEGFIACAPAALEANGIAGCPKRSMAGPPGEGLGVVSFGGTRVNEKVSINSVFAPAGGLIFYVEGTTPAYFQILEKGNWATAALPYGPELLVEVPLVETVPGADDASILSFKVRVGAAYRKRGKTVSYITLAKRCPGHGGFPVKAELKFLSGETTTVTYKEPCPKR